MVVSMRKSTIAFIHDWEEEDDTTNSKDVQNPSDASIKL